jgi:hypothetical protein
MVLERLSGAGETIIERHILVKYGSNIVDEPVGKIEKALGLKYIHLHDCTRIPTETNRNTVYNKKMKIRPCTIYKFSGTEKSINKLLSDYKNLEEITDKN